MPDPSHYPDTPAMRGKDDPHMADPPRDPDTRDDSGVEPDRKSTTGTSRWQKVVGIIGIVVVLWVGNDLLDNALDRGPGGGGGGPGPGQGEPPAEHQEQETDAEDGGDHAPPEGGD
jgi:hypothetical protein